MKKIVLSDKIIIPLILLAMATSFAYDVFRFYSNIDILLLAYASEILMILLIVGYYVLLRRRLYFQDKSVQENLATFTKLLVGLYALVIIIKSLLDPSYSPATFPQSPETLGSVIYSNIISLVAVFFMTPILMILKNLIYYRRKKGTVRLMRLFLGTSVLCILLTVGTRTALNFSFSGAAVYSNSVLIVVLILSFLLSLRNSWITFLTKKEKVSYFFISIFMIWGVLYLFDFAFSVAVPAHSLAVGTFTNITWYLMVSYMIFGSFYLLLQLPTATVFDRKMKEVSSLQDLSRSISAEFDFNRLVKLITRKTSEVVGSESAWLELQSDTDNRFEIASSHNLSNDIIRSFQESERQKTSREIIRSKSPLLVNELAKHERFKSLKEWKKDIGSIVGVPLIGRDGNPRGLLFATKPNDFGFDPDDVTMLEAFANQAIMAMENATLLRESFDRERMEEELRIAREVQQRLLPQELPKFEGLEIESLTITAYEVGGDYYDFIRLPQEQVGFIVGDVSGKGTSAAFYMAETKGIVQSLAQSCSGPRDLLVKVNEILYRSMDNKTFISMLMASVDCKNRKLYFARAGHCPLLYYSAQKKQSELLQPPGIGVGLDSGIIFKELLEEYTISVNEGDIFVFYTDGLSEARNARGEEYGEERLCELVKQHADKSVADLKELIIDSILQFLDGQNLNDDLTLLLLKT